MTVSLFHRYAPGATLRPVLAFFLIGGTIISLSTSRCGAQELYRRAVVDSGGRLRITTTTGREIVPPMDSGQVGFDQVMVSRDHRRVGWVALYPNCCTSYPIPLALVIRTAGKNRTFDGDGLPIWQWAFLAGGQRIAYRQAPVHGSLPQHFALYDLATSRVLRVVDRLADSTRLPPWAQTVSVPNDERRPE